MTSKRKFYKSVIQVTVLSEDDRDWLDLEGVAYDITDGDCVGSVDDVEFKELDGKQAADMLYALGSEPGFFRLDDNGDDTEDWSENNND